ARGERAVGRIRRGLRRPGWLCVADRIQRAGKGPALRGVERVRPTGRPGQDLAVRTIVLVEGVTDELALTLSARRSGRDLEAEGVSIVPINGAHAISRFLRQLAAEEPEARLAGLYDEGEEDVIRAALE